MNSEHDACLEVRARYFLWSIRVQCQNTTQKNSGIFLFKSDLHLPVVTFDVCDRPVGSECCQNISQFALNFLLIVDNYLYSEQAILIYFSYSCGRCLDCDAVEFVGNILLLLFMNINSLKLRQCDSPKNVYFI